ncbi:Lipoprotein-anchoring transpeptidase ErfK/SrfK [Allokutzneria albata]|uniref:Lipoprotein-anchoring transpeptidase ErfK/SrfK n=2 Tax=Allokutzneria albata TaxID=211114 RepID=A0A1G9W7D5_ALLAB|nr:Lipoprotein-anchoring transpeptidase ErfK/SrfK [Allokutzneria albata]
MRLLTQPANHTPRHLCETITTGEKQMARGKSIAVGLAVVAALGLSACTTGSPTPQTADGARPAESKVVVEPADKATGVAPASPLKVSVSGGALGDIRLTGAGGKQLAGKLSDDKSTWTATEKPDFDAEYTFSGTATGADGKPLPVNSSFRTVKPRVPVTVSPRVTDGGTYGVAQPVWLVFPRPGVRAGERAAVEKAVTVETTPQTEGSWGWIDDENLVWRPKEYFQPGTRVTVRSGLRGVHFGNGSYGKNDYTVTFTIGRHQLVRADTDQHRLIVERDGKEFRNYPASYGRESDPKLVTKNGRYFIMSKHEQYFMKQFEFNAHWALRLSNNGEFIHANPDSVANQGRNNVSHGCANLSMKDAKDYYATALEGDPVVVTGSSIDLAAKGADFWAYPWDKWTALSAVKR